MIVDTQLSGSLVEVPGLLDVLPLRTGVADVERTRVHFPLSIELTDQLRALSRGRKDAPASFLCAALALVEARLTGAEIVGVTCLAQGSCRQTIVNTTDIRLEDACRSVWTSAPLLDAAASPAAWVAVSESGAMDPANSVALRALSLWQVEESAERLSVDFIAPLSERAVDLLAACVVRALAGLVGGQAPAAIEVVDPCERERQMPEWNRFTPRRTEADTVHACFDAICQRTPDAVAVIDGDAALSYRELDVHAARLAVRLRSSGVMPGDVVAVCMSRSAAAIVGLLAVLRAGAAYLPFDVSLPAERIAYMRDEAGARVALVDGGDAAAAMQGLTCLDVSLAALSMSAEAPDLVEPIAADGEALAYVMYTSGSTGTPKGVAIAHRSILRLVCDVDYIKLGPDTRLLHAAPLGFDASTLEIWGALLNGGTVVVHDEIVPTGQGMARIIARHGVTTAWLTAALFNGIVDDNPAQLVGLRELFTGGEALSVDHVRRMRAAVPGVALHNGYGPTECTTFTCTYAIPAEIPANAASIPIGRPIADTPVYILNASQQLLPIGVAGELYVGGSGVARGYFNREDLTAERFIAAAFAEGQRLYRTGDLVRYRDDGVIEFIGRRDTQVKIRGLRIELGEIEAVLGQVPGIRSCAVVARAGAGGEKQLVAYVMTDEAAPSPSALRAQLAARLPDYMVPARYLRLEAWPVTANGKLDRKALPAPDRSRPELAHAFEPPINAAEREWCAAFASLLDLDEVGRHDNFFELGGSSLLAVRLIARLGKSVPVTLLFQNPTPATLVAALESRSSAASLDQTRMARGMREGAAAAGEPIAIIAMAGRFPGAADVEAFWQNLCDGQDSITVFRPDELDPGVAQADRNDPSYVPARGIIDGVEQFDAAFFGIPPREAELMDPQQRIFLELAWECLERGGHVPDATEVPVGVFAGMYNATYYQRHVSPHTDLIDRIGAFQVMLGNEKDYIATRVAHKLNLTGPAISVHTACSTSLVAICQAVDSLRAGRCDMALAGGASVTCPPRSGYRYQEGSMLSPDGHTRTFDAQAKGTVFSDGAAVVLLKRLSDALADGNPVYALIRGGAVNNDGAAKASFTAPSADGQAAVIAMAHDAAGVDARSISYVEAHGTATPLGDPIEIEGLNKAFRRSTDDTGFCRIGSVKSNVGHLVIAAGAAGVIKTALSLHEQRIPSSLHYQSANPALGLDASPFVVNAQITAWPRGDAPRRAGVSAFGVGGTNAHVVLEEAPPSIASESATGPQLLVVSARTPTALAKASEQLAQHLERHPQANLADVAWTLSRGRKAFAHRVAVAVDSATDAVNALRSSDLHAAAARSRPARHSDVVFLFPGQGAVYAGMGRSLHAVEPAFRAAFDECAELLRESLGLDLRELVFGDDAEALLPTAVMQPATFAIEYSLARLWMELGIKPAAMIGHSVGEFVAATLAGVFSLRDALHLVARRGALMQAQPVGGMLSVRMALDALMPRLPSDLSLAAENAPGACVVAGSLEAIAEFQAQLESEGVACRALRTSHAFHSSMMEPVLAPFLAEVAAVTRSAPNIPVVSTATGDWLDADTATSAEYWARHLREPVRFATALGRVLDTPSRVLLEVGPRATLCTLSRQHPGTQKQHIAAVPSLADTPDAELRCVRAAVGQLWTRGVPLDPSVFDRRARRQRLCLPTYPFERQRYWIEAQPASANVIAHPVIAIASVPESSMPHLVSPAASAVPAPTDRLPQLLAQLREVFEDVAGFDLADADADTNFIELGLDSLMLTQVALQLQKTFPVKITFRQLMGDASSLSALAAMIAPTLPPEVAPAAPAPSPMAAVAPVAQTLSMPNVMQIPAAAGNDALRALIAQQMQLMSQQLALLAGQGSAIPVTASVAPVAIPVAAAASVISTAPAELALAETGDEEAAVAHTRYDVKKAFGAIARIDRNARFELDDRQRGKLDAFIRRYAARTAKSKQHTEENRAHNADPRVVNGFRPLLKEIIYQIVIERSKGSKVWDLDGNEYVDALNGFGMNLFGWQPEFIQDAVRKQMDLGYEIGPQHPLAGEVTKLVCEMTGHDRAALCNTGSEAVLGTLRIARTVTGRKTIVMFTGAYHGINDEVIVRGTKNLRSVPAAPGILRNTSENILVLDYGTPETLEIIRSRIDDIAAVLVETVQSRRPDFQPREFLHDLRKLTEDNGSLLIFDEVVTGFRSRQGGAQQVFDIRADLCAYGKVVGGGFPIGVIAGKRDYMDAIDGGHWQFGDDSTPTVGVTYFAGTFVRHPLALAAAKAVLTHLREQGPQLQDRLNARTEAMANELTAFCAEVGAPIIVKHFASVWKTHFLEDHPLQDLLFAMMRSRGIHILDGFPCFLTTAHSEDDFARIIDAFKDSVLELQDVGFLPRNRATSHTVMDAAHPAVPGAKLGRDPDGKPAWYAPHPEIPGKFVRVGG